MAAAALKTERPAAPPWIGRRDTSPLERMPLLGTILAAAAQAWTEGFLALSATPTEMSVAGLRTYTAESLVAQWGSASCFAVLAAPAWNAEMVIRLDRSFVAAMVDALFGGDGDETDLAPTEAPSPLELQIAELMAGRVAEALNVGFAARMTADLRFDRFLAKPDFSCLGRPGATLIAATLTVRTFGRSAALDVVIPQAALEPRADRLAPDDVAEAEAGDPRWSRRLEAEVGRALTPLRAAIEIADMDLGTLARLVPGQILRLPPGSGANVTLASGSDALFRCNLGQAAGLYTLRIEEALGAAVGREDEAASMPHPHP